jgi:hypothetical protein
VANFYPFPKVKLFYPFETIANPKFKKMMRAIFAAENTKMHDVFFFIKMYFEKNRIKIGY